MSKIRTRFAPSPTGFLHIGSLRTALYSYLYAKQNSGDFVIRIEDTDQTREVEGAVKSLITTLESVGLSYDEGPITNGEKGEYGPYFQSKRLEIYEKYAQRLLKEGHAFYSFVSGDALNEIKKELSKTNTPLKQKHLKENLTSGEINKKIEQGDPYVIRLAMPEDGMAVFADLVRGTVEIDYATMDDFVIMKSDGYPTYNFANVIDDHKMKITHVIRGEEFIPSMPKHLYLYELLKFDAPKFAHLPLILNPDKSKLSKRQGDVAVEDYISKGYLPQTLINFVALLGWNPGEGSTEEFFTLKELIEKFDIKKIHKAGAVFDTTKLDWMNGKYLREKMTIDEFLNTIFDELKSYLEKHSCGVQYLTDKNKLNYFAQLIRERIDRTNQLQEFFEENQWLDKPKEYDKTLLTWKKSTLEDAVQKLKELIVIIENIDESSFSSVYGIEKEIKKWITQKKYSNGDILWPMRVALTGQERSPNPFEIAYLIGREEAIKRLRNAVK